MIPSTLEELYRFYPEEGSRCLSGCGECCSSDFPVSRPEVEVILKWIVDHISREVLQRQYQVHDAQPQKCPFLTADKRCLIYPIRPFVCRQFGHLDDLDRAPMEARARISQKCPKGVLFTTFKAPAVREVYNKWHDLVSKGRTLIREFRNAVVADKMGFRGVLK